MQLSTAVASIAMILAAALAAGHALGEDAAPPNASAPKTAHKKAVEREAQRRAAALDQQKRRDYFTRRCSKPIKTPMELEECREAYRQM